MTIMTREVVEGTQYQGESETLRYQLTTTPWGSTPSTVVLTAKDMSTGGTDVTAIVFSGATTILGDVITLKPLGSLTKNHLYRIEVQFTDSAMNIWEPWFHVAAQE